MSKQDIQKKQEEKNTKVYLIKNIAPWMVDELICFSKYSKFRVILLREPSEFYQNDIKALRKNGIDVSIKPFKYRLGIKEILTSIKFILAHWSKLLWGYNAIIGWKSIMWFLLLKKDLFGKNTIIHAQFASQATLISLLLKKYNQNTRYFSTFHAYDIYFDNKWLNTMVDKSEMFFSISDFNINYIKNHYNGINLNKVCLSRLGVRRQQENFKNREGEKEFVIGLMSWFVKKKGINYLLKAMTQLPSNQNIKLYLAGDGPKKEDILNYISENNLQDKCVYLGTVRDQAKKEFFESIDTFILPSIKMKNDQDGIPVVLMEAVSYGLPLISTNISGIPEICVHNYNGLLIKDRDVEAIKDAILFLSENVEERKRLSVNSCAIFEKYDIKKNSFQKMKLMKWLS